MGRKIKDKTESGQKEKPTEDDGVSRSSNDSENGSEKRIKDKREQEEKTIRSLIKEEELRGSAASFLSSRHSNNRPWLSTVTVLSAMPLQPLKYSDFDLKFSEDRKSRRRQHWEVLSVKPADRETLPELLPSSCDFGGKTGPTPRQQVQPRTMAASAQGIHSEDREEVKPWCRTCRVDRFSPGAPPKRSPECKHKEGMGEGKGRPNLSPSSNSSLKPNSPPIPNSSPNLNSVSVLNSAPMSISGKPLNSAPMLNSTQILNSAPTPFLPSRLNSSISGHGKIPQPVLLTHKSPQALAVDLISQVDAGKLLDRDTGIQSMGIGDTVLEEETNRCADTLTGSKATKRFCVII